MRAPKNSGIIAPQHNASTLDDGTSVWINDCQWLSDGQGSGLDVSWGIGGEYPATLELYAGCTPNVMTVCEQGLTVARDCGFGNISQPVITRGNETCSTPDCLGISSTSDPRTPQMLQCFWSSLASLHTVPCEASSSVFFIYIFLGVLGALAAYCISRTSLYSECKNLFFNRRERRSQNSTLGTDSDHINYHACG